MTPSRSHSIPFFDYPYLFTSEEEDLVALFRDAGRRGAFILQEDLARFESHLAAYLGVQHALGVGNATDGLLIALRAAGIAAGDEVIFSSHTMVATAAAIHFAGAVPVPVECGPDHLIDAAAAEEAITPRTRAILPTQLNGRTADMDALARLAAQHDLAIVEDAAQALGSRFRGQAAGTFGAAAAFSFFPAKVLGCLGDGGAVTTNDAAIYDRMLQLRDHGRRADGEIVSWGLNSRLDNLQAAILDHRLAAYGDAIARRRSLAGIYQDRLGQYRPGQDRLELDRAAQDLLGQDIVGQNRPAQDRPRQDHSSQDRPAQDRLRQNRVARGGPGHLEELKLAPGPLDDADHFDIYQNYEIEAARRDSLREHLKARGIGTSLPWGGRAVHQWPQLGFRVRLPFTEACFERMLLLPLNLSLTDDDVHYICDSIQDFYRGSAR